MSQADARDHFELYRDNAGEWRWRLRADNGEIVAASGEGYKRRNGAQSAIGVVKRAAAGDAPVEVLEGDDGE